MKKCNVCGNPIPDDCTACPYCLENSKNQAPNVDQKENQDYWAQSTKMPYMQNSVNPQKKKKNGPSTGAIVAVCIAVTIVFLAVNGLIIFFHNRSADSLESSKYSGSIFPSYMQSDSSNYSDHNNISSSAPSNNQGSVKSSSAAPSKTQENTGSVYKPDGTYRVGKDIPAGLYCFKANSGEMGYYSVETQASGTGNEIIKNEIVYTFSFFEASNGQYVTVEDGYIAPSNKVPKIQPQNGIYGRGTYRVGIDIPAGEYNVVADSNDDMPYFSVMNNVKGGIDEIETNDIIKGNKYITVKTGQFLELDGAYINVK